MARNKYGDVCYFCGKHMKPGYRRYEIHHGEWVIRCPKCASNRVVRDTDREALRVTGGKK